MKRVFAVLALALCLLPVMAFAEIRIDGVAVTPDGEGYIKIYKDKAVIEGRPTA